VSPTVDPTNENFVQAWDGDEGTYWAANAQRLDDAIAAHHSTLMNAAAIQPDERVLDVGCGTGQATRDAARAAPDGSALGLDLSSAMLDVARELAASQGIKNVSFEHADAQIHPFDEGQFDVVISRNGSMFFGDPIAAFENLARALTPGGRLAMVVWQGPEPNVWMREIRDALAVGRDIPGPPVGQPGPFAFVDPDKTIRVLSSAGFSDVQIDGLTGPMWLGSDADDAQGFVLGQMAWMLRDLDDDAVLRAKTDLHNMLTANTGPKGVTLPSAIWLVQARRP
jgi:SAM-dependent methyltransferase